MTVKFVEGNILCPPSKTEIDYLNNLIQNIYKKNNILKIIKQNNYFCRISKYTYQALKIVGGNNYD